MAEDNKGGGTFDQPKIGKKPLPKGSGDSKTNAQVFGLIGQQVMRINKLTGSVESSNYALIDALRTEFDASNAISEKQLNTFLDVKNTLLSINESLLPFKALTTELNEDGVGKKGKGGKASVGLGVVVDPASGKDVEMLNAKIAELEATLQRLGGKGGGGKAFLGGALTSAALGGTAGGAVGGAFGGAIGGTLAMVGLGLGAITGALYLGAAAVDKFGTGLSNIATGLEDLDNITITAENFRELGKAINLLTEDVDAAEARGVKIFSEVAFKNLSDGLKILSATEVDTSNITAVGHAIREVSNDIDFLGPIALRILDGTQFEDLAAGIEALGKADFDKQILRDATEGLSYMVENVDDRTAARTFQLLGNANLTGIANGLSALGNIDNQENLKESLVTAGDALGSFLLTLNDPRFLRNDFAAGSQIIQRLGYDDALGNVASGIITLSEVPNPQDASLSLTYLGVGLRNLLQEINVANVAALKWITSDSFKDLADGIDALMMFANETKEVLRPDGTTEIVRNADRIADDFEEIGKGMKSINDSVTYMGTFNLKQLAIGNGGIFTENTNVLMEIAKGMDALNKVPDIDTENFLKMGQALYTLVTAARGQNLADVLGGEDLNWWESWLVAYDEGLLKLAGLFGYNKTQEEAIGLQELGKALQQFEPIDETVLNNFANAAPVIARVMEQLRDGVTGDDMEFKNLHRFTEAIADLDPSSVKAVSELSHALGLSVRGIPITADQVDALGKQVLSQLMVHAPVNTGGNMTNIVDNTQINSPVSTNMGSYTPAVIHVSK